MPMQITAKNVDDYITEAPIERREVLTRLRDLCREVLTDFEETMAYQVPSYKRNGEVEVCFASQKHFIALYILKTEVMDVYRAQLKGLSIGKGCIRFVKPEKVDFHLVEQLLGATQESKGSMHGQPAARVL